jgi:hypothetical protein
VTAGAWEREKLGTLGRVRRLSQHRVREALIDKLGIVETMRFLSLKSQDQVKLDSVERHRRWQAQLDVAFASVFKTM